MKELISYKIGIVYFKENGDEVECNLILTIHDLESSYRWMHPKAVKYRIKFWALDSVTPKFVHNLSHFSDYRQNGNWKLSPLLNDRLITKNTITKLSEIKSKINELDNISFFDRYRSGVTKFNFDEDRLLKLYTKIAVDEL